jgi:hypothetical protein
MRKVCTSYLLRIPTSSTNSACLFLQVDACLELGIDARVSGSRSSLGVPEQLVAQAVPAQLLLNTAVSHSNN